MPSEISIEEIAGLEPDIIVSFTDFVEETVLDQLGEVAPVLTISGDESQEWDTSLRRLAKPFALEQEAEAAIEEVERRGCDRGESPMGSAAAGPVR